MKTCTILQCGPSESDTNPLVQSMAEGIATSEGWQIKRLNGTYFTDADAAGDLAVVCGAKRQSKVILDAFRKANIPVIILELGYLNRATTYRSETAHYQCSLNDLCWMPPAPCPSDRFEKLGLKLRKRRAKKGSHILILGQVPGDGQHHMDADALTTWYADAVRQIRERTELPIVFRAHPKAASFGLCPDADSQQDPAKVTLKTALRNAVTCVTYNSTAGTEAMLDAIPVICSQVAMYAPWADSDFAHIEAPNTGDREDYFSRLAYAQWTHAELQSGEAFAFLRQFLEDN